MQRITISPDVVPSRLYKYQAVSTRSLANLIKRALFFSRPTDFNDPFDCALTAIARPTESTLRRLAEAYKPKIQEQDRERYLDSSNQPTDELLADIFGGLEGATNERVRLMQNDRGVACLTEVNDDVLMWSRYADGHRGFCLEFDTSFEPFGSMARRIEYSDEVPELDAGDALLDEEYDVVRPLVLTKSTGWAYEREWRLLHMEAQKTYTYDWRCLSGIYLGCSMPEDHIELICMILHGSPTGLHQMLRSERQFRVSPREFTYRPFDYDA